MKIPVLKKTLTNLFKSTWTRRYPREKKEAPAGFRGYINFDPEKCTGCGVCKEICPAMGISIMEKESEFTLEFDMGSCTFCQLCADLCPAQAINLTQEYSITGHIKEDMIVRGTGKYAYCSKCGRKIKYLPREISGQFSLEDELRGLCSSCRRKFIAENIKNNLS